jgi:hypothetical protein
MWKMIVAAVLAVGISGAVFAQTGSGSTSGSRGSGATGTTPRTERLPGTLPGRSDTAPGGGGASSGGAIIPPGQSPSQQTRRGRGTSDLNNNSATIGPTGVGPTSVGPTSVGPTSLGPTGLGPTGIGSSGSMSGSTDRSPAIGTGTGARDFGPPDSSLYNPGAPSRQR